MSLGILKTIIPIHGLISVGDWYVDKRDLRISFFYMILRTKIFYSFPSLLFSLFLEYVIPVDGYESGHSGAEPAK